MFQEDWILSQIEQFAAFVARIVFKKDTTQYRVADPLSHTDLDCLHFELLSMLKENRINDAEDLLFDYLDVSNKGYLELAVDFYSRLNTMSDEQLEDANFSREEVEEGLHAFAGKYGIRLP